MVTMKSLLEQRDRINKHFAAAWPSATFKTYDRALTVFGAALGVDPASAYGTEEEVAASILRHSGVNLSESSALTYARCVVRLRRCAHTPDADLWQIFHHRTRPGVGLLPVSEVGADGKERDAVAGAVVDAMRNTLVTEALANGGELKWRSVVNVTLNGFLLQDPELASDPEWQNGSYNNRGTHRRRLGWILSGLIEFVLRSAVAHDVPAGAHRAERSFRPDPLWIARLALPLPPEIRTRSKPGAKQLAIPAVAEPGAAASPNMEEALLDRLADRIMERLLTPERAEALLDRLTK